MAQRTQGRLRAITGSIADIVFSGSSVFNLDLPGDDAFINADDLGSLLGIFAGAIGRISGRTGTTTSAFTNAAAGTFYQSIVPDSAGGQDIGSISAEWGDIFIGDAKTIKIGAGQEHTIADAGPNLSIDSSEAIVIGGTNATGVTIGASGITVTIPGNLDINGTTTTIDTANLTVEDSIIGLGVSGSDGTFTNVGDRGIVFAKGVDGGLLPSFFYNGTDSIFNLGSSATAAASASFTSIAQGNWSDLRLGLLQFQSANDWIGVNSSGVYTVISADKLAITASAADIEFHIDYGTGDQSIATVGKFDAASGGSLILQGSGSQTAGTLKLGDNSGQDFVTVKAHGDVDSGGYQIVLPASGPSASQFLRQKSDNLGLEFATIALPENLRYTYEVSSTIAAGNVDFGATPTSGLGVLSGSTTPGEDFVAITRTDATLPEALFVYVNGRIMASGSTEDYEYVDANTIDFKFQLEVDDIVQIIQR